MRATPAVGFTSPGAPGERASSRAYTALGYSFHQTGPYCGHAFLLPRNEDTAPFAVEEVSVQELLPLVTSCAHDNALYWEPDEAALAHYFEDPDGRIGVRVVDGSGSVAGGATVVNRRVLTDNGPMTAIILDHICMTVQDPDALRALAVYAARRWPGSSPTVQVHVPNVWGLTRETIKGSGMRQKPTRFNGYVASRDPDHPFLHALGTTLEIA